MASTPILPFASWASGTNQNSIPANDNSRRNQILSGLVISQAVTAQPGSPTEGDIYIIAATHTGTQWATFTPKDLAIYSGGTWYAFAPVEGVTVNVAGALYKYESGAWVLLTSGGGGGTVAGSDKQVQYNDSGAFGAEAGFEYDKTVNTLTVDKVRTAASSTTSSGLRLPPGTAPTSPTDGDVWTTTSGIYARINGVTVGPLSAGGSATQGKQTIAVTSGGMRPSLTSGCQPLVALEIASTNPEVVTLNFDPTTEESAQFSIAMPKKWNLGTMTVRFRWSHASTTTNFGVVWSIAAVSIGDGETMAGTFGTAQQIADTGGTTNALYVTSETPALTAGTTSGGIAAGDTVFFKLSRKVADGSDTLAVDARLHGLDIFITTNADTDA